MRKLLGKIETDEKGGRKRKKLGDRRREKGRGEKGSKDNRSQKESRKEIGDEE